LKHLLAISCCALALGACTDPADKAAKKRIFSPEDPPQAVAAASQQLPPHDAADNPAIARRILGMSAAETTERIGAHRASSTVDWEWTQGGKNVRLKETRELVASAGGMSGDFHAKLSNTNNSGLEVMRVGGRVFARSTWGKDGEGRFRERSRDRGMAERIREDAFGALKDLDQLFAGRLKLTAQSSTDNTAGYLDRTAWKYSVSLADSALEPATKLPPLAAAKNGADETTKRRQHFYDARVPVSLQGELWVDAQTSVVLKAHIVGKLTVKGEAGDAAADLRITVDSAMTDLGKAVSVSAPKDSMPDEDKPDGIAAALGRFGISKKGDGGVALDEAAPLDDEETSDESATSPKKR
jgi:hypothetical protein